MNYKYLTLLLLSFLLLKNAGAQTLPVGSLDNVENVFRRQQLLGSDSSNSSFMVRPLMVFENKDLKFNRLLLSNAAESMQLYALPVVWQQQYNTDHPYGANDGAMIPARGYQTLVSAGFFAKIGFLSIQLRPEYVFAENKYFMETIDAPNPAALKNALASYSNSIDQPERFGNAAYSRLSWGQSSIRLNYRSVSLGLSNENLWWGPGIHSSLLMSNTAPGFKHLTLNTIKPIKTPIGSFETQLIGARLEASGIVKQGQSKPDDWRYLSALVFTYQPKWVSGLYLGFDRAIVSYHQDMGNKLGDYLPLLSGLTKGSTVAAGATEEQRKQDQLFSLFARWVMPETHAEIYFQYGKEDHAWNARDFIVEPEHSRAYVAGFRKLVPLRSKEQFIQIGVELTQMEPAGTKTVRNEGTWYTHSQIKHGYTHQGQVLGAGYGPDNLQTLDVSWVQNLRRLGIFFERRVHNNNAYYAAFAKDAETRRHWVDLNFGGNFNWEFKGFLVNSQLVYNHALNYQYQIESVNPVNVNNVHFQVGLLYRL